MAALDLVVSPTFNMDSLYLCFSIEEEGTPGVTLFEDIPNL
jgi:hypothetical protein